MSKNFIRVAVCASFVLAAVNCSGSGTTTGGGTASLTTAQGASGLSNSLTTSLGSFSQSLGTADTSESTLRKKTVETPFEIAKKHVRLVTARNTETVFENETYTCTGGGDFTFGGSFSYDDTSDNLVLDMNFSMGFNNCLETSTAVDYDQSSGSSSCEVEINYDGDLDYVYNLEANSDFTTLAFEGSINSPTELNVTIDGDLNTISFNNFAYAGNVDVDNPTAATYTYSGSVTVNGTTFDAAEFDTYAADPYDFCN